MDLCMDWSDLGFGNIDFVVTHLREMAKALKSMTAEVAS